MSEDTTTTTEDEAVQAQETEQLDESSETQAVQVEETEEASEEETTDTTDQDDADDAEILEWATKKGLKLDDPVALAKMVRESEQKMHTATKEANALKNSVNAVSEEAGYDDTSKLLNRLQVTEFYLNNPEAKALDDVMADIVKAKPYLADDLETVYEIARARSQATDTMSARQQGRQETLAQVAKAQKAAPPKASATTRETTKEITDADIANMSASEYVQYKKDHPEFNPF